MDKNEKTCGCQANSHHDREKATVDLMSPLKIRGLTFKNRIGMSPMCQYSAIDGMANDWHLVHLGSRAAGGVGLVMVEATGVTSQGRISPGDMGIWDDKHIEPLARIARFVKTQGAMAGIQIAHAGRKASCKEPWKGGGALSEQEGAWQVVAPSAIRFSETYPHPVALDEAGIKEIVLAFEKSANRALKAGFEVIEIHAAHGYLLHEFLSPLSNQRTDSYGGSFENRTRLLREVCTAVRRVMPDELPLFVRISATDWAEGGWDINQSVELAKILKELGVDLIDVSSGGMLPKVQIPIGKGYQVPFAQEIRDKADILTAAVGLITDAEQANEIVTSGQADIVLLGRELLKEPYWAIKAEHAMDQEMQWPLQYGYAFKR